MALTSLSLSRSALVMLAVQLIPPTRGAGDNHILIKVVFTPADAMTAYMGKVRIPRRIISALGHASDDFPLGKA